MSQSAPLKRNDRGDRKSVDDLGALTEGLVSMATIGRSTVVANRKFA